MSHVVKQSNCDALVPVSKYRSALDFDHKRREEYLEKYSVAQTLRARLLQQGCVFRVCRNHACATSCSFKREDNIYVCELTGNCHVCTNGWCNSIQTREGWVCPVTGLMKSFAPSEGGNKITWDNPKAQKEDDNYMMIAAIQTSINQAIDLLAKLARIKSQKFYLECVEARSLRYTHLYKSCLKASEAIVGLKISNSVEFVIACFYLSSLKPGLR